MRNETFVPIYGLVNKDELVLKFFQHPYEWDMYMVLQGWVSVF